MDILTPAEHSTRIRLVRGKDTAPELCVRRLLQLLGYRYPLHRRELPNRSLSDSGLLDDSLRCSRMESALRGQMSSRASGSLCALSMMQGKLNAFQKRTVQP